MKFTSEDLMKAMKLSVGDKVKIKCIDEKLNKTFEIYEIKQQAGDTYLQSIDNGFIDSLAYLIDKDYEILPKPKRVGELDCFVEIKCNNCPLRLISGCTNSEGVPLYDILKEIQIDSTKNNMFDQEIYDLLKARLDKEVE